MPTEQISQPRDSMVFYRSFFESIQELPNENQLEIYTAIFELSFNFKEIELTGLSKTVFRLIKPQIEANNRKFIMGCKGAEHGKKGGRPPKKTPSKPHQNPIGDIKNNPIKTPNDNVNDNVNDNDITLNTISNIDANIEEKISPLTQMRRESLQLWKKIAHESKMKFTNSEWDEIYGYIIAKPSLQPHEITTTLRSIHQWANDGLDIRDALRAGQKFKSLARPKTIIMHDKNNQRIYGKGLTDHRNHVIQSEEMRNKE